MSINRPIHFDIIEIPARSAFVVNECVI